LGIVVSPCLSAFILVTNTSPNATCLTPTPQQARAPPREQSGPAKLRLVGSSVHSPRLLHGVMHVARPSASVSSRSSVGAVSREPVQGVALFCPPAVARPSLRPPSVRVCRKDAAVVTVATQCLTTLSWAVWPRCPPAKTFLVFAGGWIRVSLLSTSHALCPTHLAAIIFSPVVACA